MANHQKLFYKTVASGNVHGVLCKLAQELVGMGADLRHLYPLHNEHAVDIVLPDAFRCISRQWRDYDPRRYPCVPCPSGRHVGCPECRGHCRNVTAGCFICSTGIPRKCPLMTLPPRYADYQYLRRGVTKNLNTSVAAWPNGVGDRILPGTGVTFQELVPFGSLTALASLATLYGHSKPLDLRLKYGPYPNFNFGNDREEPVSVSDLREVRDHGLSFAQKLKYMDAAGVPVFGDSKTPYGDTSAPGAPLSWEAAQEDSAFARMAAKPLSHWLWGTDRRYWQVDTNACWWTTEIMATNLPLAFLLFFYRRAQKGELPDQGHIIALFWYMSTIDRFLESLTLAWIQDGVHLDVLASVPDPQDWSAHADVSRYLAGNRRYSHGMTRWVYSIYRRHPEYAVTQVTVPRASNLDTMCDRAIRLGPLLFDHLMRVRQKALTEELTPAWHRLRVKFVDAMELGGTDSEEEEDEEEDEEEEGGAVGNVAALLGAAPAYTAKPDGPAKGAPDPARTGVTPTEYCALKRRANRYVKKTRRASTTVRGATTSSADLRVQLVKLSRQRPANPEEFQRIKVKIKKMRAQLEQLNAARSQAKDHLGQMQQKTVRAKRKLSEIDQQFGI